MNIDADQWQQAQQQMANADPEQMRAQARMMKNMDKASIRRMAPQFANMSDAQIDMAASQMEMMANNPAMMKMAMNTMSGMSHTQANSAMKMAQSKRKAAAQLPGGFKLGDRVELHSLKGAAQHNGKEGTITGAQGERCKVLLDGTEAKTLALKPANLTKLAGDDVVEVGADGADLDAPAPAMPDLAGLDAAQMKQAAEAMKQADPEQLKAQAQAMRDTDPAQLRAMNPQFAGMSDAEIRAAADQMDQIAGNPQMMQMAREQLESMPPEVLEAQMKMMQNMTPEEKRKMQEAAAQMMAGGGDMEELAAKMASGEGGMPDAETASKMMSAISEDQMASMMDVVKKNPDMVKNLIKSNPMTAGMTDEQVDEQLKMLDNIDEKTLKLWMGRAKKVHAFFSPAITVYSRVNKALGGKLPQLIAVGLLAIVCSYVAKWLGLSGGAPEAAAPDILETVQQAAEEVAESFGEAAEEEFEL